MIDNWCYWTPSDFGCNPVGPKHFTMRALFLFLMTNCLNLQSKVAAKAFNIGHPIIGNVPQARRSSVGEVEPQVFGNNPGLLQEHTNHGVYPGRMFRLPFAQLNPVSLTAMGNRQGSTTYYPGPHQLGSNSGGGGGPSKDGIVGQHPSNFRSHPRCTAAWCTAGGPPPDGPPEGSPRLVSRIIL